MPALKRILVSEDSKFQLGSLVAARLGRLFTADKLGIRAVAPLTAVLRVRGRGPALSGL